MKDSTSGSGSRGIKGSPLWKPERNLMFSPSIEQTSPKKAGGGDDAEGGDGSGSGNGGSGSSVRVKSNGPLGLLNNMHTPNGKGGGGSGSPQFTLLSLKSPQIRSSLAFSPKAGTCVGDVYQANILPQARTINTFSLTTPFVLSIIFLNTYYASSILSILSLTVYLPPPLRSSGVLGSPLWKPGKNQATFFRPKQHQFAPTSASTSASASPMSNLKLAPFGAPSRDPQIFSPKPKGGKRGGWSPRASLRPNRNLAFSPHKNQNRTYENESPQQPHQSKSQEVLPPPPRGRRNIDEMYRSLGLSSLSSDNNNTNNFVAPRRLNAHPSPVKYPSPIKFSASNYDRFSDDEDDDIIPEPQPMHAGGDGSNAGGGGGGAKEEVGYHHPIIIKTPSKSKGGMKSPKRNSQMPLPPWSPLSPEREGKWIKNRDGKWIENKPQKLSIEVPGGHPYHRSPRARGRSIYSPKKTSALSPLPQQPPKAWNVRSKWRRGAKSTTANNLAVPTTAAGCGVAKIDEKMGVTHSDVDKAAAVTSTAEFESVRSPRSSFITLESILPSFFTAPTTTTAVPTTTNLGQEPTNASTSEPSTVSTVPAVISEEDQMDTMWKWIQWGVSSKVPQARYASEKNTEEVGVPIPHLKKEPSMSVLPPVPSVLLPPVPPSLLPPIPGPFDDSKSTSKTNSVTATPFYHTAANSGTTTPFFHDTLNDFDGDGDGDDPIIMKKTSPSPSLSSSQKLQDALSELAMKQQQQQQQQQQEQMQQHLSVDEEVVENGESLTWADVSSPSPKP